MKYLFQRYERVFRPLSRPNAVSVYSNGRYRELITQADGSIVYVPRARSSEVELTEEDIRNLKFKDANGKFVNYKE